jgi:hypothetical protein
VLEDDDEELPLDEALVDDEDEEDDDEPLDEELPELPSFLVELYRSEYQPPPLSTKLDRLTWRESVFSAPQDSHFSGAGSPIFWRTSMVFSHLEQVYS